MTGEEVVVLTVMCTQVAQAQVIQGVQQKHAHHMIDLSAEKNISLLN